MQIYCRIQWGTLKRAHQLTRCASEHLRLLFFWASYSARAHTHTINGEIVYAIRCRWKTQSICGVCTVHFLWHVGRILFVWLFLVLQPRKRFLRHKCSMEFPHNRSVIVAVVASCQNLQMQICSGVCKSQANSCSAFALSCLSYRDGRKMRWFVAACLATIVLWSLCEAIRKVCECVCARRKRKQIGFRAPTSRTWLLFSTTNRSQ